MTVAPFNPLDTTSIAKSICDELLRQPVIHLAENNLAHGAGIYAIYYTGTFDPYRRVSEENRDGQFCQPIYVGKAASDGSRKGGVTENLTTERALSKRIANHLQTIKEINNLDVSDFYFRSLSLVEMWISIGENGLIEKYQPLWNRILDGFGNKTPGKGRASQQRSSWDTIHPGRKYVAELGLPPNSCDEAVLKRRITEFLASK